jgi:hypothetical protein
MSSLLNLERQYELEDTQRPSSHLIGTSFGQVAIGHSSLSGLIHKPFAHLNGT